MPRRTKKLHAELYDDPTVLFPGCNVTLWPNGRNEMWISTSGDTYGFRITVSNGPAGLSLQVDALNPLRRDMDVIAGHAHIAANGVGGVSVVQYYADEKSQAFRRAFLANDLASYFDEYPEESAAGRKERGT